MTKKPGPHKDKRLTDARARTVTEPGRYPDGGGLYLMVDPSGARRWVLRLYWNKRRHDIGLGGLSVVSLAQAREKARELRAKVKAGSDPLQERRRADAPTFETLARKVHEAHVATWKNGKHQDQWINTLATYVFPVFGSARVDQIEQRDVLKVLAPIWTAKPETARRVRQRLALVFDWAKSHGYRVGDNPLSGIEHGLPKQTDDAEHMAALPYEKMAGFIVALRASGADETTKLCMEYMILSAARPGEARLARWDEFDTAQKLRTIPKERMKASAEHTVPLTPRMLEIVDQARARRRNDNELVFPGRTGVALSDATLAKLARSLGFGHLTAHGFRSTFKDWATECTNFPSEAVEKALAHAIKNKVEAAYRRGDLLEKRRQLMAAWGAHCLNVEQANVVPIRAVATAE